MDANSRNKTSRREFLKQAPASLLGAAVLPRKGADAGSPAVISWPWPRSTDARFTLCAGDACAMIVAGEDLSTAQYFASALHELTGRTFTVSNEMDASNRPIVLVGDATRDSKIRRLVDDSRVQQLGPEGILLLTTHDASRPLLVVAGGSSAAVNYACGELLNFHVHASRGEAHTLALDLVDNPELPYRIFWNWDHSTNWARGVPGEQEHGCINPYLKPQDAYLADFKKCIDYMGEHKLNGLIIWGFLRDSHGGVKNSKEVVNYSKDHGVRILPGIGTSYYGGFYYEGNHPFNVDTWLAKNPRELRFLDAKGVRKPDAICPSMPQNQQWLREGAEWLFSEFSGLGGVNLENGDFFTCQTENCKRERQKPANDPNFYWDMVVTQLPIIKAGERSLPDGWFTYATYTGFNPKEVWKHTAQSLVPDKGWPHFVTAYPDHSICQWTFTHMVAGWGIEPEGQVRQKWPRGLRPPTKRSIGLLHQGSQWWPASSWWSKSPKGNNTGGRYEDISELIRYTCERSKQEGLQGLEILGEVSPDSPVNELNYLALEEFSWHPNHTMQEFIESRLSKVYGSAEEAKLFLKILKSEESAPEAVMKNMHTALEVSRSSQFDARQKRRWKNLASEMARRLALAI